MNSCPMQVNSSQGPLPYEAFYQQNDPRIRDLAWAIMAHYSCESCTAVKKITYYVKKHYIYKSDKENFGMEDFWMLPTEILDFGSGDCDDMSFFLASLLEAVGVPTMVVLGNTRFGYHAFVRALDDDGEWLLIESTNGTIYPWVHHIKRGYFPDLYITPSGCMSPEEDVGVYY